MILRHVALLLVLVPVLAAAQTSSSTPPSPLPPAPTASAAIREIKIAELAFKPSLTPVLKSFASTHFSKISVEVHLDHDTAGSVTDARLAESSGSASLDQAILAWTKRIELKPGAAGTGRLPFAFKKP